MDRHRARQRARDTGQRGVHLTYELFVLRHTRPDGAYDTASGKALLDQGRAEIGAGRDYLIATALTWRKSVSPPSVLRMPSCTSVVMPSALASSSISATRAFDWMSRFSSSVAMRSSWMPRRPR